MTSRRWTVTCFMESADSIRSQSDLWKEISLTTSTIRYMICGVETCPETTRLHLQAYLEVTTPVRMSGIKSLLMNSTIHLEKAIGTPSQNQAYCSKEGDYWETGRFKSQGARTDLESMHTMLKECATEQEIRNELFGTWAKYPGLYKRYKQLETAVTAADFHVQDFPQWETVRLHPTKSMILWGDAGIGKTCFAMALLGNNYLFVSHMDQLKTFNAEKHKNGIIFDDMAFIHLPRESQIHLTDREQERAIHCRFEPATIPAGIPKIFTTNTHNGMIFNLEDGAIRRRLEIIHLEGPEQEEQ